MGLTQNSFLFSKNIFQIQNGNPIHHLDYSYEDQKNPKLQSLSPWIVQSQQQLRQRFQKKNPLAQKKITPLHSLPKGPSESVAENSKTFIFWIKEKKDFQINYHYDKSFKAKTPLLIENFIFLEPHASLDFLEWNTENNSSNVFTATYIYVGESAHCRRFKINQGEGSSYVFCCLNKNSVFFDLEFNVSSASIEMDIEGKETNSLSIVHGLNLLQEKQKAQQKICNRHQAERGISRQFYRSVLGGRSKNTLHSKAMIQAQEVDSNQMIQNLVLGPYAKAETQPELEVEKDRVKAVHGATVGQPNPLEIFYLNSRGLSKDKALEFLVRGWINQIFHIQNTEEPAFNLNTQFLTKVKKTLDSFLNQKVKGLLLTKNNH